MDSENQEVVISGIAGKFPECNSIDELKEKLFSKSVLLKPDEVRKPPLHETESLMSGRIPVWDRFDNTFFGVAQQLLKQSDPMIGMGMEAAFEAMLDAGFNAYELKGRRISVIASPSPSDCEHSRYAEGVYVNGFGMLGNGRTMMANRISYTFNFTGPSYTMNMHWSSGMMSLERAVSMVASGEAEAAIVVTANNMLNTSVDLEYRDLGLLSKDGVCRPFDAESHGFVRSEAAVAFFVQRRQDAKRSYGVLKKIQVSGTGSKECSYIQIDPKIESFFRSFYSNLNERPEDVAYIEANGASVKDVDEKELNALANVFCSNKKTPQLIGSIYGNTGYCESPSALVAMVKAIIAMETGVIPPTINYRTPNPNVPALATGKLKPVTEETELPGDLVAVNSVSCFGALGHVLLKRNTKVKRIQVAKDLPEDELPRLILLQARHEEGIKAVCEKVKSMAVDVEFVSLVNDAFKVPIPSYLWRGYTIVPSLMDNTSEKIQEYDSTKRPLWFVFSGMGSQWAGMGRDLLQIPIFASSIERCDKVLQPRGIDIKYIISTEDSTVLDNILHSFVGITAIQIGLVDVLKELKIMPDGIIGHSLGELGCAYTDGCFTLEETILASYARGQASIESLENDYIKGMMAAVGLGYNAMKDNLPPTIDIACHNSSESCTLSGPTEDVYKFVEKLKSEGVFAKAVSAGGIAYHSRYIQIIAPKLLNYLNQVLSDPKPRSSKWISTSVLEPEWNTEAARLCSPVYHANNLLNPVYFEEGCKHIPPNAILLEIAPHGLLQAILRRSFRADNINLSLTNRTAGSSIHYLLKTLGDLHLSNVDVDINRLYPPVQYPVSRGTPSLSSLATWNHDEAHYTDLLPLIDMLRNSGTLQKSSNVHPTAREYKFWRDHQIKGQVVLPLAQILMFPWEMILSSKHELVEQCYTIIEDVAIKGHVTVNDIESEVISSFSPSSLKFEMSYMTNDDEETNTNILTGKLAYSTDKSPPIVAPEPIEDLSDMEETSESEIYLMLSELGCDLGPQFKVIKKLYIGRKECVARVQWNGNLITFVEALFKTVVIFKSHEKGILLHPNSFNKLTVDVPFLMNLPPGTELEVHYQSSCNRVSCQGAELLGISLSTAMHTDPSSLVWSEFKFQPYFNDQITAEEFLSYSFQTVSEDGFVSWEDAPCTVNILVIRTDDESSSQYTQILKSDCSCRSSVEIKISQVDLEKAKEEVNQMGRQSLMLAGDHDVLASLLRHCEKDLYCISFFRNNGTPKYDQTLKLISVHQTEAGKLALLKKVTHQGKVQVCKIESSEWLNELKGFVEANKNDNPIIAVTHSLTPRQVLPALSKEPYAHRIRTVFIQDRDAPQFSLTSSFYCGQLALGLSVNILSGGVWGTLRSSTLDVSPCTVNLDNLITSSNKNLAINCVGLNTTTFTFLCEPTTEEPDLTFVDYSGMQKGHRVMGVGYFVPEVNALCPDSILSWSIPEDWTMENAATVPVLYTLAYYCINLKAKVEAGEHVFVHAGMSPVGQAVIAVALQAGARVLASVMDEEEALILTERFPNLKRSQVFVLDKEDINVAVRARTGSKGVEVIFNCFRGNYFQSTMKIADTDCRILHLAEIRVEDREAIGLYNFFGNKSAYGITLKTIEVCSDEWKKELQKSLKNGIDLGIVRPLKKRPFRLRDLSGAIRNLQTNNSTEKTVLISKYEDQILPLNGYFPFFENLHIIAGENVELKFQLAEWLIQHGAKKLILINDKESREGHELKRVNRKLYRNKSSTVIYPSSCLDSAECTVNFLKEILRIGPVSSIFCVCMDENSNKIKNLDSASRELLPGLQQFVSLLGKGTGVCDDRAKSGLPACSIKGDGCLETPDKVLPYLFSLLTETQTRAKFYFVSTNFSTSNAEGELDSLSYLPRSVEELYALGECVESQPRFTEEVTRSPGYSSMKYCLLPVFVIPGLGRHSLRPLLRQLMHPAFCCSLPVEAQPIEELAQSLAKDIMKIQTRGPYNIVGESWGGALALAIGRQLEALGKQVKLTLIQGIPTAAQSRLQALCKKYNADLGTCLLNVVLNTHPKDVNNNSWSERLAQLVQTLEPDVREPVARAVTALNNQMTTLLQVKPFKQLFKGAVILIRNKRDLLYDVENLYKFCQEPPSTVNVGENNHCQLLASFTTATAINENMLFDWRP